MKTKVPPRVKSDAKDHKGNIRDWYKEHVPGAPGLGYVIWGFFEDHPEFQGFAGHTSYVMTHDKVTGEIETRNSKYTLTTPAEVE
jgi:hypothetical protein